LPKEYVLREGPQFTLISPSFKDGDFIPRPDLAHDLWYLPIRTA